MSSRRNFLKKSLYGIGGLLPFQALFRDNGKTRSVNKPIVVSTWNFGQPANKAAWKVLSSGKKALDAVEQGVRVPEGDPGISTVGYGGLPDRDGRVTLDACIQDKSGDAGSVAVLEKFKHPVSVARKVMEQTPHVMLAGKGAQDFAVEQGFQKTELLTKKAKRRWEEWVNESDYEPDPDFVNHDTIGMLALDENGDISGACTTSGLAWKMHGRVADTPIIGSGLFVDNNVGAACATGVGEEVIKIAGSHTVVELMRHGHSPDEACKLAVERVLERNPGNRNKMVAFLALNKQGEYGGYSTEKGFSYAVRDADIDRMVDAPCAYKPKK